MIQLALYLVLIYLGSLGITIGIIKALTLFFGILKNVSMFVYILASIPVFAILVFLIFKLFSKIVHVQ